MCQNDEKDALVKKMPLPVLQLQKEHKSVLKQSGLLLTTLNDTDSKRSEPDTRRMSRTLNRLSKLLDVHQAKEEQLLLPIIQDHLDPSVSDSMANEHQQLFDALDRLWILVDAVKTRKGKAAIKEAKRAVAQFDSLMRGHFSREENILFWFASLLLSDSGEMNPVEVTLKESP